MAEPSIKVPVHTEGRIRACGDSDWRPLESLQHAVDHLFDDFDRGFWRTPLRRPLLDADLSGLMTAPATDVVEHDKDYVITIELPGLDESNIDVKLSNQNLTVTGEKKEVREEKEKDYFLSERRYGSFRRSFQLPTGVDADKIAANFSKGVLTLTLPKTPAAQKPEKKIAVKTG